MNSTSVIKSSQEQAVGAWIGYLNSVRIERIRDVLSREKNNLSKATRAINEALKTIDTDIVNKGAGRGGSCGMHGFIAEVAECGVGNARSLIEGGGKVYEWIDDNGPDDLKRGSELIQQKFVNSGGHLSLQAIKKHFSDYPDYLNEGGKYQIPADHYERIKRLLSISEDEANRLQTSNGDFSLKQWREVHEFFATNDIPIEKIEPSHLEYSEVQKGTYRKTLSSEKKVLKERKDERTNTAITENAPSLKEGFKATIGAAAVEGGMAFCLGIIRKIRSGKKLVEFGYDDWMEITSDTGEGALKGTVRGSSIYILTNYTKTTAESASAMVTASFGIAEQSFLLRNGALNETEFILNSEVICLDAAISALSSFAGQVIIPIPVLGAVIGNAVGTMMYQLAKDSFEKREQSIIQGYLDSIYNYTEYLDNQYQEYVSSISEYMISFMSLVDKAFAMDPFVAFSGSIKMAKLLGVPSDETLDSKEKIYAYFMD